jgi:hypothetical protein
VHDRARQALALAVCLALAACASTSLVNQWKNPAHAGAPLRKVLVVGVTTQPSVRGVFEDEFSAQLKKAGVAAVPSYTVIVEAGRADQPTLEKAVQEVAADGVLVTRLIRREQRTEMQPGYYYPYPAPGLGFYGWYSSAWVGYYEPPVMYQYDIVTAETSVYSPGEAQVVWSGITETFAPQDVKKETTGFARIIIDALKKQGVI